MGKVVDKTQQFQGGAQLEWVVMIEVAVSWNFLRKAIYCFFTRKNLAIRHTFDRDPMRRERQRGEHEQIH